MAGYCCRHRRVRNGRRRLALLGGQNAACGIIDQIGEGTGVMLPDPADLKAFGEAARLLLGDQDQVTRMGRAAHAYVRERFLGDVHLLRYAGLPATLIAGGLARGRRPAALAPRLGTTVTSREQLAGRGGDESGPTGVLVAAG